MPEDKKLLDDEKKIINRIESADMEMKKYFSDPKNVVSEKVIEMPSGNGKFKYFLERTFKPIGKDKNGVVKRRVIGIAKSIKGGKRLIKGRYAIDKKKFGLI